MDFIASFHYGNWRALHMLLVSAGACLLIASHDLCPLFLWWKDAMESIYRMGL